MYTLINIYSLPNTPNIIANSWSWNNINNHWSKSNRQMIDSRYRWETPIWLHSLAALTKSSKTNWEIFNVNIAMPFLFFGGGVWNDSIANTFSFLVAEFGGILGLFLGFSFIAVWDQLVCLKIAFHKISSK